MYEDSINDSIEGNDEINAPLISRVRNVSLSSVHVNSPAPSSKRYEGQINSSGSVDYYNNNLQNQNNINENDEAIEIVDSGWLFGYSKTQFKVFVTLCLISFTDVMGYSIIAPFFPNVAEQNGMSATQIGFIFASYSMAGIFSSVLTGSILVNVGAKFLIIAGMFLSAGSIICLSLLEHVSSTVFFVLSISCRVFNGVGSSMAFTAMFAIIFQEFENKALTVIGISESLCGVSGILGPLFGGFLYQVGGYVAPFIFLGCIQALILGLSAYTLPSVKVERHAKNIIPLRLLRNFTAFYAALLVVSAFTLNSFLTANMSIFLSAEFGMNSFMIGVVFLVFGATYALATPLWGYLSGTKGHNNLLITVGCFVMCCAMILLSPPQFVLHWLSNTEQQQWTIYPPCAISGLCFGAIMLPTFGDMLIGAKQLKLHSNVLAEYGLVSGLWNMAFSIGDILGPTVGGALSEKVGFGNTCSILGLLMFFMGTLKILHIVYIKFCAIKPIFTEESSTPEERTNLLNT